MTLAKAIIGLNGQSVQKVGLVHIKRYIECHWPEFKFLLARGTRYKGEAQCHRLLEKGGPGKWEDLLGHSFSILSNHLLVPYRWKTQQKQGQTKEIGASERRAMGERVEEAMTQTTSLC